MAKKSSRPIVGVPCDLKIWGPHPYYAAGEKYVAAVNLGADCLPLLLPVPAHPLDIDEILDVCDGIFLTGSASNVHPDNYGAARAEEGGAHDPQRDALTLPLIRACVARAVPLLCVCRGFQELNVAFGGTLHQHLHAAPGEDGFAPRFDHREERTATLDTQYGPAHNIEIEPGGALENIIGTRTIEVNSLHGQGIDNLAARLTIEARAADGTIEAVSVPGAPAFALGVQWHPEWKFAENPASSALFAAFGRAVRKAPPPIPPVNAAAR